MKLPTIHNPALFAKYLFIFTAAVLDVFALLTFMRITEFSEAAIYHVIYAFLMFADAALMLLCAFRIQKQKKSTYWFAVLLLAVNIIVIIFDQIGLTDILFAALNAFTLYILLAYRAAFTPQP
jgi:hypothetical protein